MFRIERTDDETFTVVSDDANAENAYLSEAVMECLPHLLEDFEDTPTDAGGILRFAVKRSDWGGLADAVSYLEGTGAVDVGVAEEQIETAMRERS